MAPVTVYLQASAPRLLLKQSMIKCTKCNKIRSVEEFYWSGKLRDIRSPYCKPCWKSYTKDYSEKIYPGGVRRHYRENKIAKYIQLKEKDRVLHKKMREMKHGNMPECELKYREMHPERFKAASLVHYAVKTGKLLKEPCEICGRKDMVQGHHDDYDFPLAVRWLCPSCHKLYHVQLHQGQINR